MTGPHDRRGFLRGLASLPLIGGGVTLIGRPTAAAVPVTRSMLQSYNAWLLQERRHLMFEMHGEVLDYFHPNTPGGMYHWRAFEEPRPAGCLDPGRSGPFGGRLRMGAAMSENAPPPRYTPDRIDLESVLIDVEGDSLLLDLAIEELFQRCTPSSGAVPAEDGYVWLCPTKEQARAVTHAAARVGSSVRALSAVFYGTGGRDMTRLSRAALAEAVSGPWRMAEVPAALRALLRRRSYRRRLRRAIWLLQGASALQVRVWRMQEEARRLAGVEAE